MADILQYCEHKVVSHCLSRVVSELVCYSCSKQEEVSRDLVDLHILEEMMVQSYVKGIIIIEKKTLNVQFGIKMSF